MQPPITSALIYLHLKGVIAEQMDNSDEAEGHNKFLPISYFLWDFGKLNLFKVGGPRRKIFKHFCFRDENLYLFIA